MISIDRLEHHIAVRLDQALEDIAAHQRPALRALIDAAITQAVFDEMSTVARDLVACGAAIGPSDVGAFGRRLVDLIAAERAKRSAIDAARIGRATHGIDSAAAVLAEADGGATARALAVERVADAIAQKLTEPGQELA